MKNHLTSKNEKYNDKPSVVLYSVNNTLAQLYQAYQKDLIVVQW